MPDVNGYVLALLRDHVGAEQAISAEGLAGKVSAFFGNSIKGREVRQIIHDLRHAAEPICSGVEGFYWPAGLQDVLSTAELEFRSEARSMLLTARKLREAGRAHFGGQTRLL